MPAKKAKKGKKIHEVMAEVIKEKGGPIFSPEPPKALGEYHLSPFSNHYYGPEPPPASPGIKLSQALDHSGITTKEMHHLLEHRFCPNCGQEAVDVEWQTKYIEFESITKGVTAHPTGVLVQMRCSNWHTWKFAAYHQPSTPHLAPLPPWTGSNRVWLEGQLDTWGPNGPEIGGCSIIHALTKAFDCRYGTPEPKVKVMLGVEPQPALGERVDAEGEIEIYEGAPGSEVTPAEPPEIRVGDRDLLKDLYDLDGRRVALLVELKED